MRPPSRKQHKVETAPAALLWPALDPQQRHRLVRGRGSTGRPLEKPTGAAVAPRHAPALLGSQRVSRTARRSRAGAALGPHDLFPAGQPPPYASLCRLNGPVKTCSQRSVARTARTHASAVGVPNVFGRIARAATDSGDASDAPPLPASPLANPCPRCRGVSVRNHRRWPVCNVGSNARLTPRLTACCQPLRRMPRTITRRCAREQRRRRRDQAQQQSSRA